MSIPNTLITALWLASLPMIAAAGPGRVSKSAPASHVAVVVGTGEPGTPMIVTGRLVAMRDRRPLAGVRIDVHQTDAQGFYDPRGGPEPRLTGSLVTDSAGRYEIRTIRPAPYPNRPIPAHIHYTLTAPDGRAHRFEVRFADDPLTTAEERSRARRDGTFGEVRPVVRGYDGVLRVVRDLRLDLSPGTAAGGGGT